LNLKLSSLCREDHGKLRTLPSHIHEVQKSRFLTSTKTPPNITDVFRDFIPFFEENVGL